MSTSLPTKAMFRLKEMERKQKNKRTRQQCFDLLCKDGEFEYLVILERPSQIKETGITALKSTIRAKDEQQARDRAHRLAKMEHGDDIKDMQITTLTLIGKWNK